MVQELINNVMKHANANKLHVASTYAEEQLVLIITHNGNGLSQEQFEKLRYNKDGLGLKNIQNRVILLRGKINFDAAPDNNRITINIPLQSTSL
jgi:signal transduction histidine kinase